MNRCATSSDRVATVRRLCDVRVTEHREGIDDRLVGAGRAADRDFIDYRNNIATFTKAFTTSTSVQLILTAT